MKRRERRCRKALYFDLDTQRLRDAFGDDKRSLAYRAIKHQLEREGFEHRQGSGYQSLRPLSDLEAVYIMQSLYRELPWLESCAQKFDSTNIGPVYDIHSIVCDTDAVDVNFRC